MKALKLSGIIAIVSVLFFFSNACSKEDGDIVDMTQLTGKWQGTKQYYAGYMDGGICR